MIVILYLKWIIIGWCKNWCYFIYLYFYRNCWLIIYFLDFIRSICLFFYIKKFYEDIGYVGVIDFFLVCLIENV